MVEVGSREIDVQDGVVAANFDECGGKGAKGYFRELNCQSVFHVSSHAVGRKVAEAWGSALFYS